MRSLDQAAAPLRVQAPKLVVRAIDLHLQLADLAVQLGFAGRGDLRGLIDPFA